MPAEQENILSLMLRDPASAGVFYATAEAQEKIEAELQAAQEQLERIRTDRDTLSRFQAAQERREKLLRDQLQAAQELREAASDLADYWPSLNVEKHYSPKMQRFLKAVRAAQRTEEPSE